MCCSPLSRTSLTHNPWSHIKHIHSPHSPQAKCTVLQRQEMLLVDRLLHARASASTTDADADDDDDGWETTLNVRIRPLRVHADVALLSFLSVLQRDFSPSSSHSPSTSLPMPRASREATSTTSRAPKVGEQNVRLRLLQVSEIQLKVDYLAQTGTFLSRVDVAARMRHIRLSSPAQGGGSVKNGISYSHCVLLSAPLSHTPSYPHHSPQSHTTYHTTHHTT